MIAKTILTLLIFASAFPVAAIEVVVAEQSTKPVVTEDGRVIYAVYGRSSLGDYLPEKEPMVNVAQARAKAKSPRPGFNIPEEFYLVSAPFFLALMLYVVMLIVQDIELEDKCLVKDILGTLEG